MTWLLHDQGVRPPMWKTVRAGDKKGGKTKALVLTLYRHYTDTILTLY
jgi:hypothetical protein